MKVLGLVITYFVLFIICLFLNAYYLVSGNMSVLMRLLAPLLFQRQWELRSI